MPYSCEEAIYRNGQEIPDYLAESVDEANYAIPLGVEVGWAMLADIYAGGEHRHGVVALTKEEMLLVNSNTHDLLVVRVPTRRDVRLELVRVSDGWQALEFTIGDTTVSVAGTPGAIKALRQSFSTACSFGAATSDAISIYHRDYAEWLRQEVIRQEHEGEVKTQSGIAYSTAVAEAQQRSRERAPMTVIKDPHSAAAAKVRGRAGSEDDGQARCPRCGSTSLTGQKQGYGIGKGLIGARIAGPLGLVAGNIGSKKVTVTCLRCGYQFRPGK